MKHIIVLEPDRTIAKCIKDELISRGYSVDVTSTAHIAVEFADKKSPAAVISELSLPGHSGSEFIYEFRTYTDWLNVPIIIYSTLKPAEKILNSHDWKSLSISEFLYKPDVSLQNLADKVDALVES